MKILRALLCLIISILTLNVWADPHTAADMTQLYYDDVHTTDCGSATAPAFLCSGLIIRVTSPSGDGAQTYDSWAPPPSAFTGVAAGGVSFSYIRHDSKFNKFKSGESNGITLYPLLGQYKYSGPDQKAKLDVLCAFPIDGWTTDRDSKGCGSDPGDFATQGKPCQSQGITTAQQWLTHYQETPNGGNANLYQCEFDVSENSPYNDTAAAFTANIQAMALLGSASFNEQNELRIGAWPTTLPAKEFPVQSFFYAVTGNVVSSNDQGRKNAQHDQQDYYNQTGEFVPVIQIGVPQSASDDFAFHFITSDQVVPIPPK
jgi:hypothetical protein